MKKFDDIRHLRISEIAEIDLQVWVIDEITDLSNDMGTVPDNEMVRHIARRLLDKLTTTYRSWYAGDVHAAFQVGLSGGYGTFRKVTVQSLFHFLKSTQNQMMANKALAAEVEKQTDVYDINKYNTPVSEFLVWARTTLNMDVNNFEPGYDPAQTKTVSSTVRNLTDRYVEAQKNGKIIEFGGELRAKYSLS